MIVTRQLITPREAAQMMGISYPTIKKFILDGKIKTIKTPGGHHRLTPETVRLYLGRQGSSSQVDTSGSALRISGTNQLRGEVVSIRVSGLMAEVVLSMGAQRVTASIPAEAVADLQLEVGDVATAFVRSTDVMIGRLDWSPGSKASGK